MFRDHADHRIVVRGTEILSDDTRQRYREKIARITLDSMVQFVGLLDARGTVLEINKVALDAVGIELSDVAGKPFWATFWWQVSEEINAALREFIARAGQGEFVRWDTPIYGRAGGKETIIIDASLCPVTDDDGKVVFICAEGRDITEKQVQTRKIAQNNIELQGLLGLPAAVVADRPRVLVVADNADLNRFVTQCLGRHYEVVSAFDGREGLEKATQFRPTLVVSDIMMPNVGGVEMIGEMRKLPELRLTSILLLSAKADEELIGELLDDSAQDFIVKPFSEKELVVRVRNLVVAQKARETSMRSLIREHEARREIGLQKRLLHSLFMQAPTLIAVLRGPEHVFELANPPICEVLGHPAADVLNRPLLDVMPEVRGQIFPSLLDRVYTTGVPHVGKETPVRFDRGGATHEILYFNFVYSPLRNIGGEIEGVFVVASDVTAQVQAREQVNSLRDAAESANRAKDEFLAMLGHELRNPLSPILTALQLMKLRGEAGSERERTVIERQINHLTRLVDDLLDVARIARGKVELKTEVVEIAEMVMKAIEMASPLLEQRTHTLTVDVLKSGLRVDGDTTRLSQVISNLLTNAAKYTPPGGEISIRAKRENDEVVLSVCDTGIGITPDMLPRIFDLFVQERQALDRSQGGLGIGLAIVRSLIERHGGTVSARSEGPGKGSEFIVRLPAVTRSHDIAALIPAPRQLLKATPPPGSVARILIVDDNEDGAELLAEALAQRGYDTRVAHDAPTALRVAAEFSPEIAFLDIGLPVMDGYELASHLREIPGLAGLRLIAVTGYGQASDRQKTGDAGFQHHFVKPVDIDTIEATLMMRGSPSEPSQE